jgi:hypothetical protein
MLHAPPRNTERSVIEKAQNVPNSQGQHSRLQHSHRKSSGNGGGKVRSAWAVDLSGTNLGFLFYFVLPFLEKKGGGNQSISMQSETPRLRATGGQHARTF